MTDIKSSHKLLLSCKNLRSRNLRQSSDGHLKLLGNLQVIYDQNIWTKKRRANISESTNALSKNNTILESS